MSYFHVLCSNISTHHGNNMLAAVKFCFLKYQVLATFVNNWNENVLPLQTLPRHIPPPPLPLLPPVSSSSLLFPRLPPAALPQSFLVLPLFSPESDRNRMGESDAMAPSSC